MVRSHGWGSPAQGSAVAWPTSGCYACAKGRAPVTSHDEHVFPYYRSPQDIRDESFTHRMRGFDENEVREYLCLIADQIESLERERAEMIAELEAPRHADDRPTDNGGITPNPGPQAEGGQAAAVLSHAQKVADQLLDAATHRAQEIIAAAQTQGHQVVRQARIRTLDQMQTLYDELDGDFRRLGETMRRSNPDG